jgi:ATP-dependent DNA helicase RecG
MTDTLRARIAGGEDGSTIFIKSAKSLQKIGRSICALLNAEGGTLFCGVTAEKEVVGVSGSSQDAAAQIEATLKAEILPLALFTVQCVTIEKQAVIVVEVTAGKDGPYVFEGGVWLWNGVEVKAADRNTLRQLLKTQAEAPTRWERRASPSMHEDDLDADEVRATVRDAQEKRFKFIDPSDDRRVLLQLGARDDQGFTQGGDALFSRNPSQRHPQCRAQLVVFSGDKSSDEFLDNRWFEGPLARICIDLLAVVDAANPLRSSFNQDPTRRSDRSVYDPQALREGIVNAFVHRDYAPYSGGLRVSIYPSRIEIWNSGRLPEGMSVAALRRQHDSIPPNPDIAHVFYLRGLMEQVGRGTELIIRRCKALGAPAPTWKDAPTGVTLTLFSRTRGPGDDSQLNSRQVRLIEEMEDNEVFNLKVYLERFARDVTDRQGRRDLQDLERAGWLRRQGRGSSTTYIKVKRS